MVTVKKRFSKGFTLIEMLIVIAIVAILAGLTIGRLVRTFNSEARQFSWQMASAVKYLYNTAATENKTVRLVFDFENNSYLAESTSESFLLDMGKDKKEDKADKKKEELSDKEAEEEESKLKLLEPSFGPMVTSLFEMRDLPKNVFLKDVYASYYVKPVSDGTAYIYFFPNGYAEPAIINFRDAEDEKHLSIKIDPFSGDVDISREYRSIENKK